MILHLYENHRSNSWWINCLIQCSSIWNFKIWKLIFFKIGIKNWDVKKNSKPSQAGKPVLQIQQTLAWADEKVYWTLDPAADVLFHYPTVPICRWKCGIVPSIHPEVIPSWEKFRDIEKTNLINVSEVELWKKVNINKKKSNIYHFLWNVIFVQTFDELPRHVRLPPCPLPLVLSPPWWNQIQSLHLVRVEALESFQKTASSVYMHRWQRELVRSVCPNLQLTWKNCEMSRNDNQKFVRGIRSVN